MVRTRIVRFLLTLVQKISKVNHKAGIKTDGCIRTYTGLKFNFINPTPDMFNPVDMTKGLAYASHYSGQIRKFFSIAEHCVLTWKIVKEKYPNDFIRQFSALIHDGQEGYFHDLSKPLKNLLPNYEILEKNAQRILFKKYNIPFEMAKDIKWADIVAQDIEANAFYNGVEDDRLEYLSPEESFLVYMKIFNELLYRINEIRAEK